MLPFPREAFRLDISRRTQAVVVGVIAVVALIALRLTLSPPVPAMAAPLPAASVETVAPDLIGPARVVDGDRLWIEGVEVRLSGVNAFDLTQTCGDVECGVEARRALHRMIADRTVTCLEADAGTFTCSVDGVDIGGALIRGGHAMADGPMYHNAEIAARADQTGAWAS
ncbi:thermonuclease family protein [Brevundimonas sp. NPDC092305]|uniref:thermonuclease family protein n=1 Tax=Brevundimonas sp. NPDC092305 TaxID=3363957 RepID=UPI00380DD399